ncbi:hypothetical protein BJ165DRAFT_1608109 [Panaeolus papilionaceus]|nr:hypothetical protein BJ165DRAFT_1608109 [Panaeolus papilionaceus]
MKGARHHTSIPSSPSTSSFNQPDFMNTETSPSQAAHVEAIHSRRTSPPAHPIAPLVELRALHYGEKLEDDVSVIIIIGLTGAGKSNFIETLGQRTTKWNRVQDIAKGTLNSATQKVFGYRMEHQHLNIYTEKPIILVDTPGFCDRRMSEMQILSEIKQWLKKTGVESVDRLLYLDRINDQCMTHSRKRSLELFKAFCGIKAASRAVVVTTMWDMMWNPRLKAVAVHRFQDMKDHYWQDFVSEGLTIAKFDNTFNQALENLRALGRPLQVTGPGFAFEDDVEMKDSDLGRRAYQALVERYEILDISFLCVKEDIEKLQGRESDELDWLIRRQEREMYDDIRVLTEVMREYSPGYKVIRDQVYEALEQPESLDATVMTDSTRATPNRGGLMAWLFKLRQFRTGGNVCSLKFSAPFQQP